MNAAPKRQIHHNYINRDVALWIDIHFGDQSFNGRVFIGHRKHGGGVYTMTARDLSELRQYILLVHASQRLDYYITANTVSGTSRNIDGLFGLQNIVIDIDCHDPDKDSPILVQAFLWRAKRDLWDTGVLPTPNSIVRTGRGVQLWWAIKPCHSSCRYYYDGIKSTFMAHFDAMLEDYPEELDGLEVDHAASINPVGYFRLPCTYNTAAKSYGTLEILHSERYDTHELAKIQAPEIEVKVREEPIHIPMQTSDLIVLNNYYTLGARRVMQMIKLRQLRNNDVGEETRNNLSLIVYCSLRMAYDHEEALDRLEAFNEGFADPMTDRELAAVIHTAKKKAYKYSNAKIIEFLAITQEEQDAIGLHPARGPYRPFSTGKSNASRDAVRRALKADRDHKILSMAAEGTSQAEIARILEISRTTVHKVIHAQPKPELTVQDEGLSISGAIYDCLLPISLVAVSVEDGQPSRPAVASPGGVFAMPGNGPPRGG